MGRGGLSRQKAITLLLGAFLAVMAAGCRGARDGPSADLTPTTSSTATATVAISPAATPTPDVVGNAPRTAAEAAARLPALLGTAGRCPAEVVRRWSMVCLLGDVDGDGGLDVAYFVPLAGTGGAERAAVFVCRAPGDRCPLERLATPGDADARPIGKTAFALEDLTGDGHPDLRYLVTACTASGCRSTLEVQTWDGTAWRNAGPGDGGVDNLERLRVEPNGAPAQVVMDGGKLPIEAGPTRRVTLSYAFDGSRFVLVSRVYGATEYLFNAVQDADAALAAGEYASAAEAYTAAARDDRLRDWKAEAGRAPAPGQPSGRAQLQGYALFRAALATALAGGDAMGALDTVIVESKEPVFASAAQAFRKGLQERGSVRDGCVEVTRYLAAPGLADYIAAMFDYGPANPRKTAAEVCPF